MGAAGAALAGPALHCRRNVPAMAPEPEMDAAPVPDLLGSILSGQSLLLMDSADVTIHRDGSLSAKRAGEATRHGRPSPRPAPSALAEAQRPRSQCAPRLLGIGLCVAAEC